MNTTAPAAPARRFLVYFRCAGCLAVSALEFAGQSSRDALDAAFRSVNPTYTPADRLPVCDCDGRLEVMGVVKGQRFVTGHSHQCECNERCVDAPGPNCSCRCGGKNHGTGMRVEVEHSRDGGAPRVSPKGDAAKRAAVIAQARDFRARAAAVWARCSLAPGSWARRNWEPGLCLREAGAARSWRKRLDCLARAERLAGIAAS